MSEKVLRTIMLDTETDKDLGHLAYNLKINKVEVMRRLIEKGLEDGILEEFSQEE